MKRKFVVELPLDGAGGEERADAQPQIADLHGPPRVTVPVHYVFGERDVLTPPSVVKALPSAIDAPGTTVVRVPNGGHMVHFDHPDAVRSIAVRA